MYIVGDNTSEVFKNTWLQGVKEQIPKWNILLLKMLSTPAV